MDVLAHIIEHSEFDLIASWRATSRACLAAVGTHLRARYMTCVSKFIPDVALLDHLLFKHGAIVSGSVALYFFLPRALWEPVDMDIYVPESEMEAFVAAVTDTDGLKLTPIDEEDKSKRRPARADGAGTVAVMAMFPTEDGGMDIVPGEVGESTSRIDNGSSVLGLRDVRQFRTPGGTRIDVICGPTDNPVFCLKRFWGTPVMNFLRPNGGFCGFPKDTIRSHGIVKPMRTPRDERALDKYRERGFILREAEWEDDGIWRGDTSFGAENPWVGFFGGKESENVSLPVERSGNGWAIVYEWPPVKGESSRSVWIDGG